jgi:hypothetical protein
VFNRSAYNDSTKTRSRNLSLKEGDLLIDKDTNELMRIVEIQQIFYPGGDSMYAIRAVITVQIGEHEKSAENSNS